MWSNGDQRCLDIGQQLLPICPRSAIFRAATWWKEDCTAIAVRFEVFVRRWMHIWIAADRLPRISNLEEGHSLAEGCRGL